MSDECSLGCDGKAAGCCPHIMEFWVALALAMNLTIGLIKSKLERFLTDCWNTQIAPRDLIRGDLAREFPSRMCTHAVGNHKKMTMGSISVFRLGNDGNVRVLVIESAHTDIRQF